MRERATLIPRAKGRVLELGIGSGLNLPFYDASRVERIYGVDPAVGMHRLARKRAARIGIPVETVPLVVEQIGADDNSFDTVVVTFTLCTIPDPVSALREVHRVLRPAGEVLFCEHGLAPDAGVRRWQERLTPLWMPLAGGCHLDRNPGALLEQAGFGLLELETRYLPGPRPMSFIYRGRAGR